jgi:hypothetical protein
MSREAFRGARSVGGWLAANTAPANGLITAKAGVGGCSESGRSDADHWAGLGNNGSTCSEVVAAAKAGMACWTSVSMLDSNQ